MRAVWYEQNGGADILEYGDMPDPQPGQARSGYG